MKISQDEWTSSLLCLCTQQFASSRIIFIHAVMKNVVDITNGGKINLTVFNLYFLYIYNEGV